MPWVYLIIAILGEVAGTMSLKASDGMTKLWPTLGAVMGYGVAFWFLAQVLRVIPVGVAYAVWSGVGVATVTLLSLVLFGQRLDGAALVGIGLIVAGVVVLNTLSGSV